MKEISILLIEQKARAYDEAIERAKKWYNAPNADKIPTYANRIIEELFPELKESEDERIRKVLIGWINLEPSISFGDTFDGFSKEQILTWLEKQGEQKPAWSEEDETMITDLSVIVHTYFSEISGMPFKYDLSEDKIRTWLKDLKDRVQPQLQWKPSAFHLECITDAISMYEGRGINAIGLKEILDDLKKLREE